MSPDLEAGGGFKLLGRHSLCPLSAAANQVENPQTPQNVRPCLYLGS